MKYFQPFGVANPDASYINGNPATGTQGSIPDCRGYEGQMRDLVNLIKAAGIVPTDADLQQLARSVRQALNYLVATQIGGNPNTLTCANTGDVPTLTSLPAGLRLFVHIPADNTGPTTLVVDSLPATSVIRANGSALSAGDLLGGMVAALVSDGTNLQIENFQGFTSSTTNNNTFNVGIPYIADTSITTNLITAVFSPAITDRVGNRHIAVKLAHTLTGPSTITVNALASAPVVRPDGTPTQRNDAFVNEMLLLAWDGTNYQIINQIGLPAIAALTANADWYVNGSTGNDNSLDGTSASVSGSHGPFATIQRAVNETVKYNMNGFNQTIHVANGNYIEKVTASRTNGVGTVYLVGSSVGACGIQGPSGQTALVINGGSWNVDQFTIAAGSGASSGGDPQDCISVNFTKDVTLGTLAFGAATRAHIAIGNGARVGISGGINWYINSGANAQYHILCEANGQITPGTPFSIQIPPALTILGVASFSAAFAASGYGALVQLQYAGFNGFGNVVGRQWHAYTNGNVSVFGQGRGYLPGSIAGIEDTGGQFS